MKLHSQQLRDFLDELEALKGESRHMEVRRIFQVPHEPRLDAEPDTRAVRCILARAVPSEHINFGWDITLEARQ
jgi:hypothetical protein